MANPASPAASSGAQDLKVTLDRITTISPGRPTPGEPLFLSNIDQTVAFPVETVYFYKAAQCGDKDGGAGNDALMQAMEDALSELLVAYYPLAGRMTFNPLTKRLEVDCNGRGVPFARARSALRLHELGEIGFGNPAYKCLVPQPRPDHFPPPLAMIQITSFRCGGFAVGLCTSHSLLDGLSSAQFLHNFASLTRKEGMLFHPNWDRTALKARDPPLIAHAHAELVKVDPHMLSATTAFTSAVGGGDSKGNTSPLGEITGSKPVLPQYSYKSFPFSSDSLLKLKQRAMDDGIVSNCSTFEAMLAHVWQARVKSIAARLDNDKPTSVLFAMDIRRKVEPPLPSTFCGNGVVTAYASALPREILSQPLSLCVERIQEGIRRITHDYIMSAIDWLEVHKGIPAIGINGSFYLSTWWKLTLHKVDFGRGPPVYAGPIVGDIVDMVLLIADCGKEEGLNLLIALQPHEMENLGKHIHVS